MLNKSKRLRSLEVEQVMKTGKSARSADLQVKFVSLDNSSSTPLRSAAVVPKSLVRKANARNTLRRALYRALASQNMANIRGNAVFFVRLAPKIKPAPVFAEELMQLLSKLS